MRNRLVGVAVGVLIAALILWFGFPRRVPPELLSESSGAIRTVAIQWVPASAGTVEPSLSTLLKSLGRPVEVIVVCGDRAGFADFESRAKSWGLDRSSLRSVIVGKPITAWSKDRFLVARAERTELWAPRPEPLPLESRTNDALVAPAIASKLPKRYSAKTLPLKFDAGDVLVAGERAIVSDTLFRKNGSPDGFLALLRSSLSKPVVWLHDVPDHHIGMFAAPLNGSTVVVGDPSLARPFWNADLSTRFGRPDFGSHVQSLFDSAARQLSEAGCRVARIPTAYFDPQVYLTYTNGVFETRKGRRLAYMPVYGVPTLDDAASEVYRSLGWDVRPIPVDKVYRHRGTIGCLVNVLERD